MKFLSILQKEAEPAKSVSEDQTVIWVVLNAIPHVCMQWSMVLISASSSEVARAPTDLTSTASAPVLVK